MESTPLQSTSIRSYRDLKVWQMGIDLVVECYQLTSRFPRDERFSLTQQIRRAVVSVPSNIAEGHGRTHLGEYLYHLSIANGSLMELETQIIIAQRLGFLALQGCNRLLSLTAELGRMLTGLRQKLARLDRRHKLKPET
ncbi:MAG: four helix bundle protein [Gemmatimonadetes bacterium]|nr:four helix bundle protein [Gemmatimonadota bacterium]